jgi:hypothetical protein
MEHFKKVGYCCNVTEVMNDLGASPRGIKKANAQGESGTDPRVGVFR